MKLTLLIIVILLLNSACGDKKPKITQTLEELKSEIQQAFTESNLPGFSVVVADDQGIRFQQSYGYADIATKKSYSNNTVHNIGSVSKTFIALSLMQGVDKGLFSLDDDINQYLPYSINNPYFPNKSITIRQLANHTSGIIDNDNYLRSYVFDQPDLVELNLYDADTQEFYSEAKNNKFIDESEYLKNVLSISGKWYSKENFSNHAPGEKYAYSNIGATLAAYLIETVTGIQYEKYVKDNILSPLSMNQTGWTSHEINTSKFATRYLPGNVIVPDYQLITKADGALISNTTDMAKYISEMLKGSKGTGTLVSEESFKNMLSHKQGENSEDAIFWSVKETGAFQHSGADPGILTLLNLNPTKNLGLFFMTNISADEDKKLIQSVIEISRILKLHNWK